MPSYFGECTNCEEFQQPDFDAEAVVWLLEGATNLAPYIQNGTGAEIVAIASRMNVLGRQMQKEANKKGISSPFRAIFTDVRQYLLGMHQ